jgi:hypothetical protein
MASNKKGLLKLPGAPDPEKKKKRGPTAAEKLQLVGTDNILKTLSQEQLTTILGKKPTFPLILDLTGHHFQLENDDWLKNVPNVLKECAINFFFFELHFSNCSVFTHLLRLGFCFTLSFDIFSFNPFIR